VIFSALATDAGNGLPPLSRVLVWFNDPTNWTGPSGLIQRLLEHVAYTVVIVVIAGLIALPIGIAIGHTGRGRTVIAGIANAMRAVPTLGLLVFLIVILAPRIQVTTGLGPLIPRGSLPYFIPALIVLVILAIPPILNATYAGIQATDRAARDAAIAMGLTPLQVVHSIELPAATPLIMSGIRSATLQVIASLTVAAYAPLVGGLGRLIVDGDQNLSNLQYGYPAMVAAGIVIAVLAIIADVVLAGVQRAITSPGLAPAQSRRRVPFRTGLLEPANPKN
jgi:osmoprotectant transport system permease protein